MVYIKLTDLNENERTKILNELRNLYNDVLLNDIINNKDEMTEYIYNDLNNGYNILIC
jgi:DNA gyrase/topoisomerase IV subunit A